MLSNLSFFTSSLDVDLPLRFLLLFLEKRKIYGSLDHSCMKFSNSSRQTKERRKRSSRHHQLLSTQGRIYQEIPKKSSGSNRKNTKSEEKEKLPNDRQIFVEAALDSGLFNGQSFFLFSLDSSFYSHHSISLLKEQMEETKS